MGRFTVSFYSVVRTHSFAQYLLEDIAIPPERWAATSEGNYPRAEFDREYHLLICMGKTDEYYSYQNSKKTEPLFSLFTPYWSLINPIIVPKRAGTALLTSCAAQSYR
jgi:hypothetical protein